MLVLKAEISFLTPNWKENWLRVWRLTIHQASYLSPFLSAGNLGGNMWTLMNIISLKDVDRRHYACFVRVTIERQRRQGSCKSHRCGKTKGKIKKKGLELLTSVLHPQRLFHLIRKHVLSFWTCSWILMRWTPYPLDIQSTNPLHPASQCHLSYVWHWKANHRRSRQWFWLPTPQPWNGACHRGRTQTHTEVKLLLETSAEHLKPGGFQVPCKFWLTFFPP